MLLLLGCSLGVDVEFGDDAEVPAAARQRLHELLAPTKEELMRHAPRALARLVHYLRQDYACLQYPVPNITEAGALA